VPNNLPNNLPYNITVTFHDLYDRQSHYTYAWINMINNLEHTNWKYVNQFLNSNWGAHAEISYDQQIIHIQFPNQSQQMAWQLTYT